MVTLRWISVVPLLVFLVLSDAKFLHLLNLIPLNNNNGINGWDQGMNLIKVAEVTIEHINEIRNLLPLVNFSLITRSTEACDETMITRGLANFVEEVTDDSNTIVGITGLMCSQVALQISPLTNFNRITAVNLQIPQIAAGAAAPNLESTANFPNLYRMSPSSLAFNKAILAFMVRFNITDISILLSGTGTYYASTASNFAAEFLARDKNHRIVYQNIVTKDLISAPVSDLKPSNIQSASRFVYASVTTTEATVLMCEAYRQGVTWPVLTWVFHSHIHKGRIAEHW